MFSRHQLSSLLKPSIRLTTPLIALTAVSAAQAATTVTVNLNARGGTLVKPGLGGLFPVATFGGGTSPNQLSGAMAGFTTSQEAIGNTTNPYGTANVAPIARAAGVKMICRFNDMLPGFPYQWTSYADWINQVTAATQDVSAHYKDVVYAIAPLNEPDNKLQGSFMSDPAIQGSTYDQKVNWLWTQTVKKIRSIDSTIPIMGPNYEHYTPQYDTDAQPRMQAFLQNAIATSTVPDIIGFHSLGKNPDDASKSLNTYYRPLETSLNVPGRPKRCCIEEFGPGGDFEGVPGSMAKFWASYARGGIDFACMGIYEYGSVLNNTLRYPWNISGVPQPNGGWYMMNWYKQMQGQYVPVTGGGTLYYQAPDAVASWDSAAHTVTIVAGGNDDDVDLQVNGVGALGIGTTVRVRLECTVWDKDPNEADTTIEHGGDPKTGTYNLFDKNLPLDASGNIKIPIHRMEGYNGYRVVISASGAADTYPTKYEAESATLNHVTLHNGSDAVPLASNNAYVGGIDFADSYLQFNVNVPFQGIYVMTVRYAAGNGGGVTHNVTVNGVAEGAVAYTFGTTGWSPSEMRTVTKRLALNAGANTIRLAKGNGNAELDYIDVRPDTHRYDAESATITDANKYLFKSMIGGLGYTFVGGINNADSAVQFAIDAPMTGSYQLLVAYGNGTTSTSTLNMSVNGGASTPVSLPATGGWLSNADPRTTEQTVAVPITLNGGVNQVKLLKGTGYAELDYVELLYTPILTSGQTYHILSAYDGKCIDLPNGNAINGTQLWQWDYLGGANQTWKAIANGDGTWKFINQQDLKVMEVVGNNTSDGAKVDQWDDLGGTNQHWKIIPTGNGTWKLINQYSGKPLNLNGPNSTNGTLLSQWSDSGYWNQWWAFATP